MIRITILALLLCFSCLLPVRAADKGHGALAAIAYWNNVVMKPVRAAENLYLSVTYRPMDDVSREFGYSIARTSDAKMYFSDGISYRFTKKGVVCVDDNNHDVMVGERKRDYFKSVYDNNIMRRCEWFRPFLFPKESILFTEISDTTISGATYKVLTYISNHTHSYNDSTGKYDLPFYHSVCYYYNVHMGVVEYICAQPMDVAKNRAWKEEYWLHYDFRDRQGEYEEIFNKASERYAQYSFHNDDKPPYSVTIYSTKANEMSDTLLHYPLLSLQGDTTSLSEFEGWILLDFWYFGCKSCYQWLSSVEAEHKMPQGFKLDAEGIRVVSINPLSDNLDKIKELVQRFHAEGFTYSAKGIGSLLEMRVMPKYYLLSPDKRIVYHSNSLGDYKELLEAKTKYEQQSGRF